MPTVWWYWTSVAELLTYGGNLVLGAFAYCGAHTGIPVVSVLLHLLGGGHVEVICSR
jgi:hypothetical protein